VDFIRIIPLSIKDIDGVRENGTCGGPGGVGRVVSVEKGARGR
jgi:hypothetical protein